jgi:hypothetical protein
LPYVEGTALVGISWYRIFMNKHCSFLRRGRCCPRDINRYSLCTYDIFSNMYDGVYASMVNAGIAVELEEEIMYNKFGELTNNNNQLYGKPTKFKVTYPEYLLLVDETG